MKVSELKNRVNADLSLVFYDILKEKVKFNWLELKKVYESETKNDFEEALFENVKIKDKKVFLKNSSYKNNVSNIPKLEENFIKCVNDMHSYEMYKLNEELENYQIKSIEKNYIDDSESAIYFSLVIKLWTKAYLKKYVEETLLKVSIEYFEELFEEEGFYNTSFYASDKLRYLWEYFSGFSATLSNVISIYYSDYEKKALKQKLRKEKYTKKELQEKISENLNSLLDDVMEVFEKSNEFYLYDTSEEILIFYVLFCVVNQIDEEIEEKLEKDEEIILNKKANEIYKRAFEVFFFRTLEVILMLKSCIFKPLETITDELAIEIYDNSTSESEEIPEYEGTRICMEMIDKLRTNFKSFMCLTSKYIFESTYYEDREKLNKLMAIGASEYIERISEYLMTANLINYFENSNEICKCECECEGEEF
ncbi:hypothetical protein [Oceanivirga miroungae]|uniref:Uncharacterized protein n=1 Tax=Oceanivirga miroungae TaxID=1130046 RepID=A0A6I8MD61_9FUSO|nr:hypothetical protein [Oceanivirga miroungae]VWL85380.1 hypothetical protein OMES3154_00665 [Oceanivirga miroungae]